MSGDERNPSSRGDPRAASGPLSSGSPISSGSGDAIKLYQTLSSLRQKLADAEAALARERRERAVESDKIAEMLVRVADREKAVLAATKRAEEACARVATLEGELATAQTVAAALDEQLIATEAIVAQFEAAPVGEGEGGEDPAGDDEARAWALEESGETMRVDEREVTLVADEDELRERAEAAERERDALRREVDDLRASLEDMRARADAMGEALDGIRRAIGRASLPPEGDDT